MLDLGAERRRFRRDFATGLPNLSADWFNVLASLTGGRTAPGSEPIPRCPRTRGFGPARSARCSDRRHSASRHDTALGPVSRDAMYRWKQWQATMRLESAARATGSSGWIRQTPSTSCETVGRRE